MTVAHILGFPRIGKNREMKKALESYWTGSLDRESLLQVGKAIRQENWAIQRSAGLDLICVGDFSWYDHILDTSMRLGVVPHRFGAPINSEGTFNTMFRMARGRAPMGEDTVACEMTKWFDTNYHYIVPELEPQQSFCLSEFTLFDEVAQAQVLGFNAKPVLVGPLTFLWLAKEKSHQDKLAFLEELLVVYEQILIKLNAQNVEWVQMDEPILGLDLPQEWLSAFQRVYRRLKKVDTKLLLTTYFNGLGQNQNLVCELPVDGIHIDVVQDPEQLIPVIDNLARDKILSVGVVNGRNVWRTNLRVQYQFLLKAKERLKERLWIGSSCSLLHTPVDLSVENELDPKIKSWLAFSVQKVQEIATIAIALNKGQDAVATEFDQSDISAQSRKRSVWIHQPKIKERIKAIQESMYHRQNSFNKRKKDQQQSLKLPILPTTTIGSFPQTQEIRRLRRELKDGKISDQEYERGIQFYIKKAISLQEELGLDVLVHGEAERNDMVEYFGELLHGFAFTKNGWVQSYGSRCVKPPIIYGDVARRAPMTLTWIEYAQSLTDKPLKGMLTGPVTMLCWSFVRDDQPRSQTAMQIALALRDEIQALQAKGIKIIQIDEPAFREGLPLRHEDWPPYLDWAVKAFRLATCVVEDSTQIHTHMCYSEFNDVIESIAALDADVITIETSRSQMELLNAFEKFSYPNEIGPGIYDIHSPRIPTIEEMVSSLTKAAKVIPIDRLWVNPDCGLKTRNWSDTKIALHNMVMAAKQMREKFAR